MLRPQLMESHWRREERRIGTGKQFVTEGPDVRQRTAPSAAGSWLQPEAVPPGRLQLASPSFESHPLTERTRGLWADAKVAQQPVPQSSRHGQLKALLAVPREAGWTRCRQQAWPLLVRDRAGAGRVYRRRLQCHPPCAPICTVSRRGQPLPPPTRSAPALQAAEHETQHKSAHPQAPFLHSQVTVLGSDGHAVAALLLQPLPLALVPAKVPHRDWAWKRGRQGHGDGR